MDRNNRFSRGKRFNRPKYDRKHTNKYKSDVQPEQFNETDVGITEYISNLDGFSGVLKARFSDFQVNEIDLSGEIAKFSNITEPTGFDSGSLKVEIPVPKETPLEIIPQSIWEEIVNIVDSDSNKVIEIDSTSFDKETRETVHCTIKGIFRKKIVASTINKDDKKFITFKKYNKNDRVDERCSWPADKEEYVHFIVYKENIDTLETTLKISDCLRMKPSVFTYAGVKDRRAKTTQWFSVRKVEPWKLLSRTRCLRNVHVGNITFKKEPLKLGQLQGNRFRIALRNVSADNDLINQAVENLKANGFINYYGLQRFGNDKEVPTYEIGVQLLLGNFKEACDLILKNKRCDNPFADISKAKKEYNQTGNATAAIRNLKEGVNNSVESKLLFGLAKSNKNDYVNALEKVPRNMRLLYIHSLQAFVWNKIVSRRIKEFGLKPVVGDLVLLKEEIEESNDDSAESDDNSDKDGENGDKDDEDVEKSIKKRQNVKILKEDDLQNYTITDVVLPMPGYDITYPDNAVKDLYKTILEEFGLTLDMPKQSVKTYTLSGAYRPIISQVTNLSWKITHYQDPNKDLIRSDFDEYLNRPELDDKPDGQYKALVVDFCLQPSCYATMVVREILKTDTSTSAHTKLNNYHQQKPQTTKKETIISTTNTETTTMDDTPAANSLLSDPAKYEDFKKSIFGISCTNDDSLKRKLPEKDGDDAVPEKKNKEDSKDAKSSLKLEATLV